MAIHPCFTTLERSRAAWREGRTREALALAEAAYIETREIAGAPPQAGVVLAWYGWLLGVVGGDRDRGLALVREAIDRTFWEPRVFEYAARLMLAIGDRRGALDAIEQGLRLARGDRELTALRQQLGVRRPPPIPFLDRSHPLNRRLGLWLAQSGRR